MMTGLSFIRQRTAERFHNAIRSGEASAAAKAAAFASGAAQALRTRCRTARRESAVTTFLELCFLGAAVAGAVLTAGVYGAFRMAQEAWARRARRRVRGRDGYWGETR